MWADPFMVFGEMSIPIFISNLVTLLIFILATYFAYRYTESFYEGRPMTFSWMFIIIGLFAISLSEIGQFLIPYIVSPSIVEGVLILMVQSVAIVLIAAGCFMLYKEVP